MKQFRDLVRESQEPTAWDLANNVLYDLCDTHSDHEAKDAIIAKVWLIGRSYAAAIERGRKSDTKDIENDQFYTDIVAEKILARRKEIDGLISRARNSNLSDETLVELVKSHGMVMRLFSEINSNRTLRSLASKYLHFHAPEFFLIFDSRAAAGLNKLMKKRGLAIVKTGIGDDDYRRFANKAQRLRSTIKYTYGITLSPRHLDNLLLSVEALEKSEIDRMLKNVPEWAEIRARP